MEQSTYAANRTERERETVPHMSSSSSARAASVSASVALSNSHSCLVASRSISIPDLAIDTASSRAAVLFCLSCHTRLYGTVESETIASADTNSRQFTERNFPANQQRKRTGDKDRRQRENRRHNSDSSVIRTYRQRVSVSVRRRRHVRHPVHRYQAKFNFENSSNREN